MALRGIILRDPALQLAEWVECIATHPDLLVQRRERRELSNPFKPGTTIVMESKTGDAFLLHDGVQLGAVGPSDYFDEDHELLVWSVDSLTAKAKVAATEIARLLNARVEWID